MQEAFDTHGWWRSEREADCTGLLRHERRLRSAFTYLTLNAIQCSETPNSSANQTHKGF